VVAGFVDIGGFVEYHCLSFLFIIALKYIKKYSIRAFKLYLCNDIIEFFSKIHVLQSRTILDRPSIAPKHRRSE